MFEQNAKIVGSTLSFSSEGTYSEIAAMQCAGELYASKLDIAIRGVVEIVLTGGVLWEEVLLESKDSSIALTVRNYPARLKQCRINARDGSSLAVEDANLTLDAVRLSAENGSGIIVSGSWLTISVSCSMNGAEDGITVIGTGARPFDWNRRKVTELKLSGGKTAFPFRDLRASFRFGSKSSDRREEAIRSKRV